MNKFRLPFILGDGLLNKVKFLFVVFAVYFLRKVGLNKRRGFLVRLIFLGKKFKFIITDGSDVGVLDEVFVKEEYKIDEDLHPDIIMDLGSNVGASILYFHLKYPKAKIYGFEPDPITFNKLQNNIGIEKDIIIENVAITSKNGFLDFFSFQDSSISSSFTNRSDKMKRIKVLSKTLDQILIDNDIKQIDLMKFDIEGTEFEVFNNFYGLDRVSYLIGEFHEDLSGERIEDFIKLMEEREVTKSGINKSRYLVSSRIK